MKVLYSLDFFPVLSETFVLNEILVVQRAGVDVFVFANKKGDENLKHQGVRDVKSVFYSKPETLTGKIFNHLYFFLTGPVAYLKTFLIAIRPENGIRGRFFHKLADVRQVKKICPNHIHAHFGAGAADFAFLCRLLLDIDFTFTTHRYDIFDIPAKNIGIKTRYARRHITISRHNRDYLIERFNLPGDKVTVVHCGIDFDREELKYGKLKQDIPHILNIGRLTAQKDQLTLIRVCRRLKQRGISHICKIIGDGDNRPKLESMIKESELEESVFLMGWQSQDVVFDELRRADVFVLTSISEGIPVCLMEAMSMNVPVVSSNINGIPELIDHGKNGYLVEPGDIDGFTQRIIDALNKKITGGKQKVQTHFNLQKEVDRLIEIWKAPPPGLPLGKWEEQDGHGKGSRSFPPY